MQKLMEGISVLDIPPRADALSEPVACVAPSDDHHLVASLEFEVRLVQRCTELPTLRRRELVLNYSESS